MKKEQVCVYHFLGRGCVLADKDIDEVGCLKVNSIFIIASEEYDIITEEES